MMHVLSPALSNTCRGDGRLRSPAPGRATTHDSPLISWRATKHAPNLLHLALFSYARVHLISLALSLLLR
jgi:hypothetical protein